jgi:hypothetical protein
MDELLNRIQLLHSAAYNLCHTLFQTEFKNSGNLGIFCQNEQEYNYFLKLQQDIAKISSNSLQKYFPLKKDIQIQHPNGKEIICYTHLYIRKPDSTAYGKYLGDIDFYVKAEEYQIFKTFALSKGLESIHMYNQNGVGELVEIQDNLQKVLVYISITRRIRFRSQL